METNEQSQDQGTNLGEKKKRTICPMPLVASIVAGLGFGILTGNYVACLVIGLGVGGVILGVTQKDALLKL